MSMCAQDVRNIVFLLKTEKEKMMLLIDYRYASSPSPD